MTKTNTNTNTTTLAITGKGGVGKTTFAALAVASLIRNGCRPVLAVDADPNTCLDETLGVRVEQSVGTIREDARQAASRGAISGIGKQEMMELHIARCLVEAEDFDLIAMGRPEGPGCYCYANNVLKSVLERISREYPYVVIDNEAGLENLSRRIVRKVDLMVMVADPSRRGLETVRRLHGLTLDMEIDYGRLALVVNRLRGGALPEGAEELCRAVGADHLVGLPDDTELARRAEEGLSLIDMPQTNPAVAAVGSLLREGGLVA